MFTHGKAANRTSLRVLIEEKTMEIAAAAAAAAATEAISEAVILSFRLGCSVSDSCAYC